jgi:type VI secretion system secreted protein Hcp
MAIYMELDGAKGDVTEQGHKNWIELLDLQWSMSRTIRSAVGVGKNRESTSAYVSEVTVTKYIDAASKGVANNAFVGKANEVQIDFTRVDKGQEAVFRTLKLTDAIISGLSNTAQGSDRPVETITLNFTKIAITDKTQSADGSAGSQSVTTYNLQTAQTE